MMIKTKKINGLSLIFPLILALALCAGGLGCAVTGNKDTLWHQHYEPVEDPDIINAAQKILAEAIRLMGAPASPVREIHVRQSVARIQPASISRADIISWERLGQGIASLQMETEPGKADPFQTSEKKLHPRNPFYPALSPDILEGSQKEAPPHNHQFTIIQELNRFIFLGHSPDQRRKQLEAMFPGAIQPMPAVISKAVGFELCETLDASPGSFVVYVAPHRNDPMFLFKLSHEICHLIQPYLYDWHIEGLCDHFAEHMAHIRGVDPGLFRQWFLRREKQNPYAASYMMIRDVKKIVGNDIWRLFQFAEPLPGDDPTRSPKAIYPNRMRVNINAWLNSLAPEKRAPAAAAMKPWSGILKRTNSRNSFMSADVLD